MPETMDFLVTNQVSQDWIQENSINESLVLQHHRGPCQLLTDRYFSFLRNETIDVTWIAVWASGMNILNIALVSCPWRRTRTMIRDHDFTSLEIITVVWTFSSITLYIKTSDLASSSLFIIVICCSCINCSISRLLTTNLLNLLQLQALNPRDAICFEEIGKHVYR